MSVVMPRVHTPGQRTADYLLTVETQDAWREYLDTCQAAIVYETVEPYAWARLQHRLARIAARREALTR